MPKKNKNKSQKKSAVKTNRAVEKQESLKKDIQQPINNEPSKVNQTINKISNIRKRRWLTEEERMLEKVEKYVDKNWDETSKDMAERKSKRPAVNYQNADIEVMISRISEESKDKEPNKSSKMFVYLIYIVIILVIIIFWIKYFWMYNVPQIS